MAWGGGFNRGVMDQCSVSRRERGAERMQRFVTSRQHLIFNGPQRTKSRQTCQILNKEKWVPQPSPCCACASVAGAFNALWQLDRSAPNSCANLSPMLTNGTWFIFCISSSASLQTVWPCDIESNRGTIREVADLMAGNCEQLQRQKEKRLETWQVPDPSFIKFHKLSSETILAFHRVVGSLVDQLIDRELW